MKTSSKLPTYLLLYIISLLDESGFSRAEPALLVATLEKTIPYAPAYLYDAKSVLRSNWSRRAVNDDEDAEDVEDVICHPAGACEPCPEDLLQEPFCQPFGNRRLLHCLAVPNRPDVHSPSPNTTPNDEGHEGNGDNNENSPHAPPPHHPASRPPQSALPAWESCGRRVPKERADFLEFFLCNVIFAALALTGVLIRSERMRVVRARRLAARIGVGLRRASSGSWAAVGGMGAALVDAETRSEEAQLMRDDADGS